MMAHCKVDMRSVPNRYGFGRDWTLITKCDGKEKDFWLGQDAKVVSRAFGTDFESFMYHYVDKSGSRDWDKNKKFIAEDFAKLVVGKEFDENLTDSDIRHIQKGDAWSFAVE